MPFSRNTSADSFASLGFTSSASIATEYSFITQKSKKVGFCSLFTVRCSLYTFHMLDFLAIGDTTIDAFIRLKDAKVHCKINNEDCELCVRFGDKVPYESVEVVPAVGNAANAAVSAARLGLKSALRAYVGEDENGK